MVRRVILIASLLSLGACLPDVALDRGPGITGTYAINGTDPLGTEYSGRVIIDRGANPEDLVIEWIVTGAIHRGDGVLDGSRITATWITISGPRGDSTGTAEYQVMDDGTIVGTRTVDGVDGVANETLFPEP